ARMHSSANQTFVGFNCNAALYTVRSSGEGTRRRAFDQGLSAGASTPSVQSVGRKWCITSKARISLENPFADNAFGSSNRYVFSSGRRFRSPWAASLTKICVYCPVLEKLSTLLAKLIAYPSGLITS